MLKLNSILQIAAVFFIIVGATEQMCTETQKDLGCCDGPFREHNGVLPEWQLSTTGGGSWLKGENWIQFNIDNDFKCGGVGSIRQTGTATIDFYVGQAETIVISMQGVAESQYEKFDLYVDEALKATVQATNNLNNGCQVSTCNMCDVSMPSQEFDVSTGTHSIRIEMDTIDGIYHNNAYFRMDFLIKQKEVCGACTCPTVNTAPGAVVLTASPSTKPTSQPTKNPSFAPTSQPTKIPSFAPTSQPTVLPSSSPTDQPTIVVILEEDLHDSRESTIKIPWVPILAVIVAICIVCTCWFVMDDRVIKCCCPCCVCCCLKKSKDEDEECPKLEESGSRLAQLKTCE